MPTLMARTPSFPAPGSGGAQTRWVPLTLDLKTGGHFLVYRLRVDGKNLEPSAGNCRKWILQRVAQEAGAEPRTFCNDDSVWVEMGVGGRHSLDLLLGSEHTVVKRVVLRPGENVHWRMPIRTGPIAIPIDVEAGHSYTVEGRESDLHLRTALLAGAPSGTDWDLDAHEPAFRSGVEVGRMRIRVLRDADGKALEEFSVPLLSGRMGCEAPFCPAGEMHPRAAGGTVPELEPAVP